MGHGEAENKIGDVAGGVDAADDPGADGIGKTGKEAVIDGAVGPDDDASGNGVTADTGVLGHVIDRAAVGGDGENPVGAGVGDVKDALLRVKGQVEEVVGIVDDGAGLGIDGGGGGLGGESEDGLVLEVGERGEDPAGVNAEEEGGEVRFALADDAVDGAGEVIDAGEADVFIVAVGRGVAGQAGVEDGG